MLEVSYDFKSGLNQKQIQAHDLMRTQFDEILINLVGQEKKVISEKAFRQTLINILKDDILDKEELCAGVMSAINDPCP